MFGDRVFFPLAALTAAGMVWLAMLPAQGRLPTGSVSRGDGQYDAFAVEGVQLNRMAPGLGLVDFVQADGATRLRIGRDRTLNSDVPAVSPHFRLAADIKTNFAGFDVEILIEARMAEEAPSATAFEANYQAHKGEESGWTPFNLTSEYQTFSFVYSVPVLTIEDLDVHRLAIRPAEMGGVDISRVAFRRVRRTPT